MTALAAELAGIPGVRGHAVFDTGYQCLSHRLPEGLDPMMLVQTRSSPRATMQSRMRPAGRRTRSETMFVSSRYVGFGMAGSN